MLLPIGVGCSNNSNNYPSEEVIILDAYPDTVTDILYLETSNSLINFSYQIANKDGDNVLSGKLKEGIDEIDCTALSKGKYILVVKETNEEISFVKK